MAEEQATIDQLIINKPLRRTARILALRPGEPQFLAAAGAPLGGIPEGVREFACFSMTPALFVEIPLVNQIRQRVKAWREAEYPGVTAVTKRLLDYWNDPEEFDIRRFFFCQLEAAETLIWLTEAWRKRQGGLGHSRRRRRIPDG